MWKVCLDGQLGFAGEESAGSSFLRRDGGVWTTDKDGIIPCLLSAEITARTGRDPGEIYRELTRDLGDPVYERIDAPATPEQKAALARLSPDRYPRYRSWPEKKSSRFSRLLLETVTRLAESKWSPKNGWFAARPSGTEDIYKIYAESFLGQDHLRRIEEEAQTIVSDTLGTKCPRSCQRPLKQEGVIMSTTAYGNRLPIRLSPTLLAIWPWTCDGLTTTPRTNLGAAGSRPMGSHPQSLGCAANSLSQKSCRVLQPTRIFRGCSLISNAKKQLR